MNTIRSARFLRQFPPLPESPLFDPENRDAIAVVKTLLFAGFDPARTIRTVDGDIVRLLAIDTGHMFPIVGEVVDLNSNVTWLARWSAVGRYASSSREAVRKHSLEMNCDPGTIEFDAPEAAAPPAAEVQPVRERHQPKVLGPWPAPSTAPAPSSFATPTVTSPPTSSSGGAGGETKFPPLDLAPITPTVPLGAERDELEAKYLPYYLLACSRRGQAIAAGTPMPATLARSEVDRLLAVVRGQRSKCSREFHAWRVAMIYAAAGRFAVIGDASLIPIDAVEHALAHVAEFIDEPGRITVLEVSEQPVG